MSKNNAIETVKGVYKTIFIGFGLTLLAIASFASLVYFLYYAVTTKELSASQIAFGNLGALVFLVFIYFVVCYAAGTKKSKQYTDNVIEILKILKPQENGVLDKLAESKIIQFFLGLTGFFLVAAITIKLFWPNIFINLMAHI